MNKQWSLDPFAPPFGLGNSHLHTIYSAIFAFRPNVEYRRERWHTEDGDFLDIDWVDGEPGNPAVIACHGLEGSSHSHYILHLMKNLEEKKWNGIVLNFRGCSGEINRKLRYYHSGETGDLNWVLGKIRQRLLGPIFAVGYSLGGNVLAKWLGENREKAQKYLAGACVCSAPYDLLLCQRYLDRGWSRLYVWNFLHTLRKKVRQKREMFPGSFDAGRALRACTLRQFDHLITAPLNGFHDYLDYYQKSNSRPYLSQIKIPTLLVSALDDPFIPIAAFPQQQEVSEKVSIRYTRQGGHIGFIDKKLSYRWLDRQILNWFEHLLSKGENHDE